MEEGEVDSMGVIKGVILLCSILIYPSIDHRTVTFTCQTYFSMEGTFKKRLLFTLPTK